MERTDIAIIGAGPIGLELAAMLKRDGADWLHLDAGQIGSTFRWWAPGTRFFSSPERIAIAGVPLVVRGEEKATREDYLDYLRQVAAALDLPVRTHTRVDAIERSREGFVLRATPSLGGAGSSIEAKRVVIAIGNMHAPRRVEHEPEHAPWIAHVLGEPHEYFRRRVLIVGGRNSAIEAAIRCFRAGAEVTLACRAPALDRERIKYWLLPEVEWLISTGRIRFHAHSVAERFEPGVTTLRSLDTGDQTRVPTDHALLLVGYRQDPRLFQSLGVPLSGDALAPEIDRTTMETPIRGVYVAGTAVAGTPARTRVFIENSHVHAARIAAALAGRDAAAIPEPVISLPET